MNIDNSMRLLSGGKISFDTKHGAEIYRRSLIVLLQCAIYELYDKVNVQIGQTLMHGYYFELTELEKFPPNFLEKVSKRMREIVEKDENFSRKVLDKEKLKNRYKTIGRMDKVRAISSLNRDKIKIVTLRRYFDYILTDCVRSTSYLKTFRLVKYKGGFVLQFPIRGNINKLPLDPDRQEKLYRVYTETRRWNSILGVRHVSDLNEVIKKKDIGQLINIQETFHEKKIDKIAWKITENFPEQKIVFIAGPSASGKTTFIKRLGIRLMANGLNTEEINLDDYFKPRSETPRTPDGDYDFESLEALDIQLLDTHLKKLLNGETVDRLKFDFKVGEKKKTGQKIHMGKQSVLLVEGIHGLNPVITSKIPASRCYKIFVSALTQLFIDNDTRIFTSDSRLMRRLIRDSKFRKYSARETLQRFPKVREGEDKYIFPFQQSADVFFNSSLIYEQAVLKSYINELLTDFENGAPEYYEARRIIKYLEFFDTIPPRKVPEKSILREFIGKSYFSY
ncbi:MAG: nucleoside kinase [Elusimicrobiota bacterium]